MEGIILTCLSVTLAIVQLVNGLIKQNSSFRINFTIQINTLENAFLYHFFMSFLFGPIYSVWLRTISSQVISPSVDFNALTMPHNCKSFFLGKYFWRTGIGFTEGGCIKAEWWQADWICLQYSVQNFRWNVLLLVIWNTYTVFLFMLIQYVNMKLIYFDRVPDSLLTLW